MKATLFILPLFISIGIIGQEKITNKNGSEYQFTKINELVITKTYFF